MAENKIQFHPIIDLEKTGQFLRNLMLQKHVRVDDLREAFNLTDNRAVYFWLEGKKLPSIDNLLSLSAYFGVSINDILQYSFPGVAHDPFDGRAA